MTTKIIIVIAALAVVGVIVGGVVVMNHSNGADQAANASPTSSSSPTASTQLQSTDEVVGTGAEAVSGKKVTVNYVGTLANGTKFDSSYDRNQPFSFNLGAGEVIKGWDQGVVGMKVGGKRKLVIPPDLGYGSQGAGSSIPPNATLTFEVELLGVN
ncbi:MAG TPA: FKBP-type peptidyl-prolyl cis-trans isomerase [Candidatus Saccharimonadia bacterium]|nr:FKBP-type peptidyl-prolyl cis-trans isomerase [Candidatus Saccharimonadia bacterium]